MLLFFLFLCKKQLLKKALSRWKSGEYAVHEGMFKYTEDACNASLVISKC